MTQRVITAVGLILLAIALMYFGGAVMAVAAMVCICFAVHEEYHALSLAGHRPVSWPTWVGLTVSIPLTLLLGIGVVVPILMAVLLVTAICVIFREEPKLEDILMSVLPLTTVVLPGMCIIALAVVQPKELQVTLFAILFGVPVLCDTMAFLVGSRVRGPKLCPAVSPNKTVSGAIAGMVGALLAVLLVGVTAWCCSDAAIRLLLPTWWEYLLLGLLGGVVSQTGDLFASMVKRHSGIKDFSHLFPGHGGMLDRVDSILFMSVLMFCYRLLTAL